LNGVLPRPVLHATHLFFIPGKLPVELPDFDLNSSNMRVRRSDSILQCRLRLLGCRAKDPVHCGAIELRGRAEAAQYSSDRRRESENKGGTQESVIRIRC